MRYLCGHAVVFEVPVILSKHSSTGYLVPAEWGPTYMKHVLAPALTHLIHNLRICSNVKPERKGLATAIKELIEQSGYNYNRHSRSDIDFLLNGGQCSDWAGFAYFFAETFKLHAIGVAADSHDTAYLCEPWWRSNYGLKLRLKNGSIVRCYIWVDTGWAVQNWKEYTPSPMNLWIDAATGKALPVTKVSKIG